MNQCVSVIDTLSHRDALLLASFGGFYNKAIITLEASFTKTFTLRSFLLNYSSHI